MLPADPAAVDAAVARLGALARTDAPLGPMTTYRVGGNASILVTASSEDDLLAVRDAVAASGLPTLVVGNGSNLLVADAGFPGIAVHLGDGFTNVGIDETTARVVAGAAASLPVVARRTAAASLSGFEWAVGVPGSIGGAVRMNAGGHGAELRESLVSARIVPIEPGGRNGEVAVDGLDPAYRSTNVAPGEVVVAATLQLVAGDRMEAEALIGSIVRWRREHQPGGQNAGSVFTNPVGASAGGLIDAAGLKEFRVGSAFVSSKHANFFQADEGGSADDVRELIEEVRRRVRETTGVDLVPELRMVGFTS